MSTFFKTGARWIRMNRFLSVCVRFVASSRPVMRYAKEVFVGLSRLGREVTYVRYEGEGHYEGHWKHANAADYLTRVLNFFERHLCQPRGHE